MKKTSFLLIVSLFFFFNGLQAQSSFKEQWTWNRIYNPQTQELWKYVGINPDPNSSIKPGQIVPFVWNGDTLYTQSATLQRNCAWLLVNDYFDTWISSTPAPKPTPAPAQQPLVYKTPNYGLWFMVILIVALLILAYLLSTQWKRENPVTSGPAMVIGGVTDETAQTALSNQAQRRFPNFNISDIHKGRLYGEGRVSYAGDDHGQRRKFKGEVGYRAILKNGNQKPETVYCLQACGNDARNGDYYQGEGLIFHEDSVIPTTTPTEAQPVTDEAIAEAVQKGIDYAKAVYTEQPKATTWQAQDTLIMSLPDVVKAMTGGDRLSVEVTSAGAISYKVKKPLLLAVTAELKNSNHVAPKKAEEEAPTGHA